MRHRGQISSIEALHKATKNAMHDNAAEAGTSRFQAASPASG